MRSHWPWVLAVWIALGAPAPADESKLTATFELNRLKADLEKHAAENRAQAAKLTDSAALRAHWEEFYTRHAPDYARALELARRNAGDSLAFDALTWIVVGPLGYNEATGPIIDQALELLAEQHAKDYRAALLSEAVGRFQVRSSKPEVFLRAVVEKNTNANARGVAMLRLGDLMAEHARIAALLRAPNPGKSAETWNQQLTDERKRYFRELNVVEFGREAESCYEKAAADYGSVKQLGGVTVGESARGRLFKRRSLVAGKPLPELAGHTLDGQPIRVNDHTGKAIVLFFWAGWCQPSIDLVPDLRALAQRMTGKPFVILGVSGDFNLQAAQEAVEKYKLDWTTMFDGNGGRGPLALRWGINSWPTLIVVDPAGTIRAVQDSTDGLDALVDSLLPGKK